MSIPKPDIQADLSAIVDGQDNDAADVLNPVLEVRGHVRDGLLAVSGADTHVKTLSEALTGDGVIQAQIANAGADEALALSVDEAALVDVDTPQALASKTLALAVISSFLAGAHDHGDAAGGGPLDAGTAFASGTVPVARLPQMSIGQAGILPAPTGGDANHVMKGAGAWGDPASGGVGTVTAVGLSMPDMFDVTGSPLTQDGTLAAALKSQAQNQVLAAPDGSAGVPAFRGLAKGDLPALDMADIGDWGLTPLVPWTTLGSAAATIDLSGIPSTYGALLLMVSGRVTLAAANALLCLRFNGDTGANYRQIIVPQLAPLTTADATGTEIIIGGMPGATAPAGMFGSSCVWLMGYAQTGQPRQVFTRNGSATNAGAQILRVNGGQWLNTAAAIHRLTLLFPSGNFAAGTRYALFGLK